MKTIQKRWLPLFLLATVTFLFPACEGNNPDDDLVGVITIKIRNNGMEGGIYLGDSDRVGYDSYGGTFGYSYHLIMTEANNFGIVIYTSKYNSWGGDESCSIVDVGKKTINKSITLPATGWTSGLSVTPKHLYVGRYIVDSKIEKYKYIKIYVKDFTYSTSGGIIGAEIQYCEWTPEQ